MKTFAERLYTALENQLNEVSINEETLTGQYRASILLCKKAMAKLKTYITTYSIGNKEDEIHFFKVIKPQFYSKYIYFINVFNFIMQKPTGGDEIVKEYINFELTDLKRFFDHNHSFYQYYRSGSSQMDEIYFTRGGFNVHVELEDFEEDEIYSTSHDYKLSKIIANEKYQDFLNLEFQKLAEQEPVSTGIDLPLTWTASKTDLVELIYALVAAGTFNNGNVDIKTAVNFFESAFHADLGRFYSRFTDIVRRKKDRTPLLDRLKFSLLNKIEEKNEEEENYQQRMKFG